MKKRGKEKEEIGVENVVNRLKRIKIGKENYWKKENEMSCEEKAGDKLERGKEEKRILRDIKNRKEIERENEKGSKTRKKNKDIWPDVRHGTGLE